MNFENTDAHVGEVRRSPEALARAWNMEVSKALLEPDAHLMKLLSIVAANKQSDNTALDAEILGSILQLTTRLGQLYREAAGISEELWRKSNDY
jgi:c-di-GMP-related signal transduction protein